MSQSALSSEPTTGFKVGNTSVDDRGIALSAGFSETAAFLMNLIEHGDGIYLLTGAEGIGKSTALRYSELHAPDNVAVIIHAFRRIDVDNLSDLLGHTLGVKVPQELPPEARALRYFLKLGTIRSKGKRLILMLDDVQELHSSGAELLKALVNMKDETGSLITVVLCGRSSLNVFLDKSYRWGIQRLIRENHEMQGIKEPELPALVSSFYDRNPELAISVKPSAFRTLASLGKGTPGRVEKLLVAGAQIARKYDYQAISSRILKGANSGEFKTLTQIATQFTGKTVAIMAMLLLVPITLFQQGLQQRADQPPRILVQSPSIVTPEAVDGESTRPETEKPAVTIVADDIPIQNISSAETQTPAAQVVEVTEEIALTASETDSIYQYSSFNTLINVPISMPEITERPVAASFNRAILSNRQNTLRLLGQFSLKIPASTQSQ